MSIASIRNRVEISPTRPGRQCVLAMATAATLLAIRGVHAAEVDVANGTTDLSTVIATSADDVTFTNLTYAPNTIGISANLTYGTLNSLDATQTLTLNNPTAATTFAITLAGGTGNAVAVAAGGASTDLIYVPTGGGLTVTGTGTGLGTLSGITFNTSGTLDINGTANLGPALTWGANTITKTGTGNLLLNAASVGTGGLTVANGTLTVQGTNNNVLGSTGSVVTLGSGSNNATLAFSSTPSGVAQSILVAAGSGTRTISASNSVASGNGVVFTNGMTLNHDLIVSETGTSAGNIQLRGLIAESGGSYGVTVNNTNQTTVVQFRGANTFTGGVTIASGTALFNTNGTVGSIGALTSGPFGTGNITLGNGANAATLASDSFQGVSNNLIVGAGGIRTISDVGAGATAMVIGGPITLNNDLNLTAISTTLTTGANRLRLGAGGLTGSGNLIVNNANVLSGAVAGSGGIRLDGSATPTAWAGSVIVQNGQFSLQSNNALGSANVVGVSSTGWFNFSEAILNPYIAGLANATAAGALGGSTGGVVQATTASGRSLTLAGTGNYTFDGLIKNNTDGINIAGLNINLTSPAGSQTLNGASTYTGVTALTGGKLIANTLTNGGTASSIGAAANGAGNLVFQGGTLQYTGAAASTDHLFTIAAPGGTIDSSGPGAVAFTNTGTIVSTDPATANFTTTTGSATISISGTAPSGSAYPLVVGMPVAGTGIPAGATVASVNIANNTFTISNAATATGTASLSFTSVNRALTLTGTNSGANSIASNLINSATATLGVTKSGAGSWTLSGTNTYTGATTVKAGSLKVTLTAQGPVLTGAGGADVQGGKLLLDYTGGSSPIASIKNLLDGEYAANSGNFTTGQIRSTTAAANGKTIGYGDNGADTVTIMYTLAGDADLNGTVDFNDFLVLQNNFGTAGTRFDQGNFNYDGQTDFNDFLALQNNFGQSVTGEPVAVTRAQVAAMTAFANSDASLVPEPTTLTVLGLGSLLMGRRRRA
ncbi:MAG: hemolysin-type calcium-binding repeat family protein autotransporter domain protein [Phycisphaerales bacterium]|nr:hemolysin-type calcium-binding repeat family protein autotransporter domain protein [Phycisphaerales bacterium]